MEYNINRRPDIGEDQQNSDISETPEYQQPGSDEQRRAGLEHVRRRKAAQRKRDRMEAYAVMIVFALVVIGAVLYFVLAGSDKPKADTITTASQQSAESKNDDKQSDSSSADKPAAAADSKPDDSSTAEAKEAEGHDVQVVDGITYIDGIMIVNKTYSIPSSYSPGLDSTAEQAFNDMAASAYGDGISLYICSGFRSYREQYELYNSYALERGTEAADEVSSRPGHSEHQTGLCMDVNTTEFSFEGTPEAVWLEEHCAEYGFIIRFPKGKEDITGYAYEPWHIRYVGEKAAKEIMEQGICLEEYLDVTSDYANSSDQQT